MPTVKQRKSAAAKRRTRRPDMAEPAKTYGELTASRHIRFGLYGDSGIGKTRFVGTYQDGPLLLLRSPVDHIDSILTAGMGSNITERVLRDWSDSNDTLEELRATGDRWDWVWLDSASLVQDVMMDDIWGVVLKERPDRYRYGLDKQEHGINQLRLGSWMRHVVGADLFNFGWTAHAQDLPSPDLDEEGDPIEKLMPYVHGARGGLAQKFCGYSNLICYMRKDKKGNRILHTESNPVYYAKNQYDPDGKDWALVAPTMPKLLAKIKRPSSGSSLKKRRRAGTR